MNDKLDEFHKHEFLDRVHCVSEMFGSLVSDHPVAELCSDDVKAISLALARLYQRTGALRFHETQEQPCSPSSSS